MIERERLIELLNKQQDFGGSIIKSQMDDRYSTIREKSNKDIADHLLVNGVRVLPCRIGDKVWIIRYYKGCKKPHHGYISEMYYDKYMTLIIVVRHIARGRWGREVFSTYQEAEQALKE